MGKVSRNLAVLKCTSVDQSFERSVHRECKHRGVSDTYHSDRIAPYAIGVLFAFMCTFLKTRRTAARKDEGGHKSSTPLPFPAVESRSNHSCPSLRIGRVTTLVQVARTTGASPHCRRCLRYSHGQSASYCCTSVRFSSTTSTRSPRSDTRISW